MTGADLAEATEEAALAFTALHLAPLLTSKNPVVQLRVTSDFNRDWQVEVGRWLLLAERHGYLQALVKNVLGAAEAPPHGHNTYRDRFFGSFLSRLAEPMAAYFFAQTGWPFREWEPKRFKPPLDVDFILSTPEPIPRDVLVQVKSPGVPGIIVNHLPVGGDSDHHLWLAVGGGPQPDGTSKKGAIGQLPSPATSPAMIVVNAHRNMSLAVDPTLETKLVGSTIGFPSGRVTLPRSRRGAFFSPAWSHCGAVVLLDTPRADDFHYSCIVFLNPHAAEAARCEREWFRGARINYLEGDTFRWQGGAPTYSTIPDGTKLVEDDP